MKKKKEKKAFKEWKEKAFEEWKEALEGAAGLAGLELRKTADGKQAAFIQKIVELVLLELRSTLFSIDEKLVGMDSRVDEVLSVLGTDCDDVRMIGIKGMGGAGKTTLARAVFDRISFQFEGRSFVEDIREVSNASSSGLKSLQNQVLSDVLNDQGMSVSGVYDGKNMLKRMMGGRKVILILDDVDHIEQLEALAGELTWFKPGSRIIITTRDEQVLVAHNVKLIRNVSLLSDKEAICLLSRYAFGKEIPIQGYEELSGKVVSYASGLPLTIRVLSSFLCGKNVTEWIDAIERLKTIPLKETLKKLELSYTCLEEDYKEIFLDVACIMKGWLLHRVIKALESRGFHAKIGLRVLEQKSLISITVGGNVRMHDHIEEMGRNIVRRSYSDMPNRHSRLWINEEIEDIFVNDSGTEATRCIQLSTEKLDPEIVVKGLQKMTDIRFLQLSFGTHFQEREYDDISPPYFPDSLNYLDWDSYIFSYLPATFTANNLVVLRMSCSNIKQLWEGGDQKVELWFLTSSECLTLISFSRIRTLDLRLTINLETLELRSCYELIELRMPIACPRLRFFNLSVLRAGTFHLGLAPNLETLMLESYDSSVELYMPVEMLKLRSLKLDGSRLTMFDFGLYPNLKRLELRRCYNLVEVCVSHGCLNLESLVLYDSNLRILKIGLIPNLSVLSLTNCTYLEELHMAGEYRRFDQLAIFNSKLTTLNLRLTPNLSILELKNCYNLELHAPTGFLKKLRSLCLSGSLGYRFFTFSINGFYSGRVDVSLPVRLRLTPERCPLHPAKKLPRFEFRCSDKDLPLLTTSLEELLSGVSCACIKLDKFSRSIRGLQQYEYEMDGMTINDYLEMEWKHNEVLEASS